MKRTSMIAALLTLSIIVSCGSPLDDISVLVGPDGATITEPGGLSIEIPAGALSQNTRISGELLTDQSQIDGFGMTGFAGVIRLEPEGQVFNKPITVSIPVPASGFVAGTQYIVWVRDESDGVWDSLGQGVDDDGSAVIIGDKLVYTTMHFSSDGISRLDAQALGDAFGKRFEGNGYYFNDAAAQFQQDFINNYGMKLMVDGETRDGEKWILVGVNFDIQLSYYLAGDKTIEGQYQHLYGEETFDDTMLSFSHDIMFTNPDGSVTQKIYEIVIAMYWRKANPGEGEFAPILVNRWFPQAAGSGQVALGAYDETKKPSPWYNASFSIPSTVPATGSFAFSHSPIPGVAYRPLGLKFCPAAVNSVYHQSFGGCTAGTSGSDIGYYGLTDAGGVALGGSLSEIVRANAGKTVVYSYYKSYAGGSICAEDLWLVWSGP